MKNILIHGLKDPVGGVENSVMNYVSRFDREIITADFTVFGSGFSLEPTVNGLGGKVHYLPDRIKDRASYKKKLDEIFEQNSYSAVWCNFSGLTNIDLLKYAKKHSVPVRIAHAHTSALSWGGPVMEYPVKILHRINKTALNRYATELWACSKRAADFMFGDSSDSARMIPNAVDTVKFAFDEEKRREKRGEFGFDESDFVVLHVGRMCREKNQCFLLDIFKELTYLEPRARLLVAGDGELKNEVTAHAKELGLGDSVIFAGNRSDVNGLLSAADVFLLPSLAEGFPVTLTEAQANGLECVSSADAIDPAVDFSGLVRLLPLSAGAKEWAKAVADCRGKAHIPDGAERTAEAGYDIKAAAKILQDVFDGSAPGTD